MHEDLDLTNHGLAPVSFNLEIAMRSDFADLFEVREHRLVRRGRIMQEWSDARRELTTRYVNRDFECELVFRLANSDSPAHYVNGRITFEIALAPGQSWHTCWLLLADARRARARAAARMQPRGRQDARSTTLQRSWLERATKLTSANEDVYRLYRQSVEDLGALRLHDRDLGPDVWLPAAGVPWFVAMFGRDSLITGLQTLLGPPWHRARRAFETSGALQATKEDPARDAEPGKIPHELRHGELAHFGAVPHTPYYGTADATPLYLITLHEAWKWTGDRAARREPPRRRRALPRVDRPLRRPRWRRVSGVPDAARRAATRTWAGRMRATRWSIPTAAR